MKTKWILPAAIMGSIFLPQGLKAQDSAPNIIFMLADDLGYGELTCYGKNPTAKTPNIDRIAKVGVRMTQAYASPVSSPTRTCLLTGSFPQKAGVYGNYDGTFPGVGPFRSIFPPVLQRHGYRTSWFGKWHQGWDVSNHPLNNGFDVAYGFLGGMHDYYDVSNGDHYIGGPFAPHAFVFDGFKVVKSMNYFTEEITDRAITEIGKKSNQPFFIYLAYNAPHTPIQAPDKAILKYLKQNCDTIEAVRYAMIDVLDESVGRILDELEKSGKGKNTLIVFMSDNGAEKQMNNGGFRGTKMTAWEGGVRIPMMAAMPGKIPAGTTSDAICSIVDMAATFVNISSNSKESAYGDGVNLMPFWQGKKSGNAHEGLVFSVGIKDKIGAMPTVDNVELLGIRLGDWKVVRDTKRQIDALYNLSEDPVEKTDLSQQNPKKKNELLKYCTNFFKDCKPSCGPFVSKDTRSGGDKLMNDALIKHCRTLKK